MSTLSKILEKIRISFLFNRKNYVLLSPIGTVSSRFEFENIKRGENIQKDILLCKKLIRSHSSLEFKVKGFCLPCNKKTEFIVDSQFGGEIINGVLSPNWRERMECKYCHMNNRQRLIAGLILQKVVNKSLSIYFMEQVTPIFQWAQKYLGKEQRIIGSEYLGYEYQGGKIINGIQHENIEKLSFKDNEFDLIISNDVFEHVPNPSIAFKECSRVLKLGGEMLATIPFYDNLEYSVKRARIENNEVQYLLEPQLHGNPLSEKGSLVFNDFGWDLLTTIKLNGFKNSNIELFLSEKYGHTGQIQLVFRLVK